MKKWQYFIVGGIIFLLANISPTLAQEVDSPDTIDSTNIGLDSLELREQFVTDSIQARQDSIKTANQAIADSIQKQAAILQAQADSIKNANQLYVDSLRANAYPVILKDTLLYIYSGIGKLTIEERAKTIVDKLQELVNGSEFRADSLYVQAGESNWNVFHKDEILMTITPEDSVARGQSKEIMAKDYLRTLKTKLIEQRQYKGLLQRIKEIGLTILALLIVYIIYRLTNRLFRFISSFIDERQDKLFQGFTYNDYEVLTPERQLGIVHFLVRIARLFTHLVMLYLTLPIIFLIFPATRGIAETLLAYVLNPLYSIGMSIINFIPNLIIIILIYLCTRYLIRLLKFVVTEIQEQKLVIPGFYPDWAQPTYNIIRVITYAFMFVLIFPYLPNSDSQIFQGVTVFVGVLFSLGSSSAISNMVAGIVITYMRPFKIGDRVQIGDLTGDVIEKNLLVTRIRTVKNEEITIPNSSILNGHTINYSSSQQLILHATVTIGYDVPWREVHELLINAAISTDGALNEPVPFVLQTSLDDFYVSYQINLYSNLADSIAETYSSLYSNIQDQFNEAGVEILSPHYRAARDGNQVTTPPNYLPDDYEAPSFRVQVENTERKVNHSIENGSNS